MKQQIPESRKKQEPTLFCTECGASLEDFSVSGDADNLAAVKANQLRCKHIGKFQGEMCAKLFIARNDLPDPADDKTPPED